MKAVSGLPNSGFGIKTPPVTTIRLRQGFDD